MKLEENLRIALPNNSSFAVCIWDIAMPRIEPKIVEVFAAAGADNEDDAITYTKEMSDRFYSGKICTAEQVALLQISPLAVGMREPDYFVVNRSGLRVF